VQTSAEAAKEEESAGRARELAARWWGEDRHHKRSPFILFYTKNAQIDKRIEYSRVESKDDE